MKKLFKKKGFTLIECLIAIAIFAIMALMVTTIYGATIRQYGKNVEDDRDLTTQVSDLATTYTGVRTGTSEYGDGNLKFSFTDDSGVTASKTIGYKLHTLGANPEDYDYNLTYMAGAVNNAINDGEITPPPGSPDPDVNALKSVDARIYGSMGMTNIRLTDFNDVTPAGSSGTYQYEFEIFITDSSTYEPQFCYRQLKFRFAEEKLKSCEIVTGNNVSIKKIANNAFRLSLTTYSSSSNIFDNKIKIKVTTDEQIITDPAKDDITEFAEYLGLTGDKNGGTTDVTLQEGFSSSEYLFCESAKAPGVYAYHN